MSVDLDDVSTSLLNCGIVMSATLASALSGSTGSMIALALFYPLSNISMRLQVDRSSERKYKDSFDCAKKVIQEQGRDVLSTN